MVPYGHVEEKSEREMEDYFEPLEDSPLPPFDYMMMLARKEKADTIRRTIAESQSSKPKN